MKHLERNWYGASGAFIGPLINTTCGKNVPVNQVTRTWSEVDCPQCQVDLERFASESVGR